MLFPLLATRVLARNVVLSTRVALHIPVTTTQITRRPFSVSSVAWASTAATTKAKAKAKTTAKKSPAKKRPASKSTAKPAKKKPKKAAAKPKAKKKVVKKPAKVTVRPEHKPPKRPGTAYTMFYTEFFARKPRPEKITGIQYGMETTKELAAAWHNLSDQEKQVYRDQASRAVEEYKKKLEEYSKKTDPIIIKEINRRRVKAGKKKLAIRTRAPTYNGFILYVNEERKNFPRVVTLADSQNQLKELGKSWSALSEQQKAEYSARAVDLNKQKAQE